MASSYSFFNQGHLDDYKFELTTFTGQGYFESTELGTLCRRWKTYVFGGTTVVHWGAQVHRYRSIFPASLYDTQLRGREYHGHCAHERETSMPWSAMMISAAVNRSLVSATD